MRRPQKCRKRQSGLTLIELMVAVAIGAILLMLVIPGMGSLLASNRSAAQTNELVGALSIARSEAVTRGLPVTVCALATAGGNQCAGAGTPVIWERGWAVFVDDGANPGVIDASEQTLRLYPELENNSTVRANVPAVTYQASGFLDTGATTLNLRVANCKRSGHRDISIAATGRVNTSHVDC